MSVSEWDQRQLCPDGACIGVIGDDGLCKVCGRVAPNWGDERNRGLVATASAGGGPLTTASSVPASGAGEHEDSDPVGEAVEEASAPDPDLDWGSRTLCPDGECVGVVGSDGTCKVCGKVAEA
jgi:hypothetical protein